MVTVACSVQKHFYRYQTSPETVNKCLHIPAEDLCSINPQRGGTSPPGSGKHTFCARSHTGSQAGRPIFHIHEADLRPQRCTETCTSPIQEAGSHFTSQGHLNVCHYGAEPWLSQQDYGSSHSIFRPITDLLAPQEGTTGVWGSTMTQHSSLGRTGDSNSDYD